MPNPNLVNKPNYTTNLKFDQLMIEAYARCGIFRPTISGDQIDDAIRSANFILVDYNNRGSNLYSIQTEIISLEYGLPSYSIPDFYEINDVTLANFIRQLGTTANPGVATTNSGGDPALAFDNDLSTACVNTTPNGEITYTFQVLPKLIQFVGFRTGQDDNQTYNLQFFYQTNASNPATKQIVYETGPFTPFPNHAYHFYLNPGQVALTWGVQEIGGATLNMAEIYFSSYNQSYILSPLSRQDYLSIANKNLVEPIGVPNPSAVPIPPVPPAQNLPYLPYNPQNSTGYPAGYYVDRQPSPVINFYPVPNLNYPFCVFTYTSYFRKISYLQDTLNIPGSFIPAITAELAMNLATKYAFERLDKLTAQRDEAFTYATNEDRQKVNLKIQYDYEQFKTN